MRPPPLRSALLLAAAAVAAAVPATPTVAAEVTLDGRKFTLPAGFVIEKVAGPPLVDRPIVADFDEQGRLYVADSSGSNAPVQTQLAEKPHRIVRLEDTDGDGRFDRRTVFADKMMFPEGAMWLDGSLYVAAPPSIWKLTDTDGDGVADRRVEWFRGKTLTGCANDLHGPYAGPDGWVYWCKGAFAEQTYERPGKPPFVTRAAHIFRARRDGTGVEPVMTGGMDNPVDVAFTPGGERVVTATFLQHPAGGRRDGLIHAAYGGVYGKVHDVIEGHKRTGPDVMPVLAHLGPAAPCGLTRYESDAFGPAYRDNLFACNFNLRRVSRHTLTPAGATFAAGDETFLSSDDQDFHPTDVIEDADGSLVVVDTGGWYKLCCPTSQLEKPDVLGAIYRVRRSDAPRVVDPRGRNLGWSEATPHSLVSLLGDSRPAVRRRAVASLVSLGEKALPALVEGLEPAQDRTARENVVWAACRIDLPAARALVRKALADPDEVVRQAAAHAVSVARDREAVPGLIGLLGSPSSQNRRAAAEALGRLGDRSAVPALLSALARPADRFLEHSLTFALIEIADPKATSAGLTGGDARTRRAALFALDQMDGGGLSVGQVAPDLASADPATRETASWIAGRHPEWAGALSGFLKDRLAAPGLSDPDRTDLVDQFVRFARSAPVQELLGRTLAEEKATREARRVALRAVARSGLKDVPASWVDGLTKVLAGADRGLYPEAVAAARALPMPGDRARGLGRALRAVGGDETVDVPTRLDALAAVPGGLEPVGPDLFAFLLGNLKPDEPVAARTAAANVLARAALTTDQRLALAGAVATAGPLEVDRLLPAFEKATEEAVGLKLVAALGASAAKPSMRVDRLKPLFDRFNPRVRREAEGLYSSLNLDAGGQKARLDALLRALNGGDVRRGQAVFNGPKAACLTCHAVGYVGGRVGPDLTGVGKIRTERDLLESVVFPSLSFVRSYEPLTVATRDGKVVNGLPRKDAPDELVLTLGATEEVHIPRTEIEDVRPGTVSVMPAGLDAQLTRQELADLLAFLKSRK